MQEEVKTATITGHFGFVFDEHLGGKFHDYCDVIVFKKLCFENVFCPHKNEKPTFQILQSGFKSAFEKLGFHDKLVPNTLNRAAF